MVRVDSHLFWKHSEGEYGLPISRRSTVPFDDLSYLAQSRGCLGVRVASRYVLYRDLVILENVLRPLSCHPKPSSLLTHALALI